MLAIGCRRELIGHMVGQMSLRHTPLVGYHTLLAAITPGWRLRHV